MFIASEILRPQVYNNRKMAWFLDIIQRFSFLFSKALNRFSISLIAIGLGSLLSFLGESNFETAELKILWACCNQWKKFFKLEIFLESDEAFTDLFRRLKIHNLIVWALIFERSDFKTKTDSLNVKFRKSLKSSEYAFTEFSERFLKLILYDLHSFIKEFNSIFILVISFPCAWILP